MAELSRTVTTAEAAALTELDQKAVLSDITGVTGADQITNMISLTQAEYNAITPSATTFYVITG